MAAAPRRSTGDTYEVHECVSKLLEWGRSQRLGWIALTVDVECVVRAGGVVRVALHSLSNGHTSCVAIVNKYIHAARRDVTQRKRDFVASDERFSIKQDFACSLAVTLSTSVEIDEPGTLPPVVLASEKFQVKHEDSNGDMQ